MGETVDSKQEKYVMPTHRTIRLLLAGGDAARRLWLALSLHADWWSGEAWPSYGTLKRDHGMSSNCVAAGIAALEEMGLLVRRRRFSSSTRYFLKGFLRPDGSSLNAQEVVSLVESAGAGHFSQEERTDTPSPLPKREPVLSQRESTPLPGRAQSSHSVEANDTHLTNSHKNDTGERGATPQPPKTEAQLVRLSEQRGLMALGSKQRADLVHSIVSLVGAERAEEALRAERFAGWDLAEVHRDLARAKNRGDPAPPRRKAPDPDCKKCDGSGLRFNPGNNLDVPCSCLK